MKFLRPFLVVAIIVLSLILILYPDSRILLIGMAIAFLAAFIHASLNQNEGVRARWIFVAVFIFLAGVIGWYIHGSLATNAQPNGYTGELLLRLIALVGGVIASFFLTLVFLVINVYVSAVYVLSIQQVEGISAWHAFRSLLSLILNINYDWIVISNGQIAKVKEKGVVKELGGPGKVIVDPGNAVVLQRGGKITQVRGAGVWMTKRNENIREVFDLTNQFTITTVKNVLTADQISIEEVEMGIGYRIVRETDPYTVGLVDSRDDTDGFMVKKDTLLKAIINNTSGGKWSGFAGGAPTVQLRDHFMTYTLGELFELFPDEGSPRPNRRRVNLIEQQILESLNSFAANLGVTITGVDIRSIKLPDKMAKSMGDAAAIERINKQRNKAQQDYIANLLSIISKFKKDDNITDVELQLATVFAKLNKRAITDDILGHEYVEMLQTLAKGDGPKFFNAPTGSVDLKDFS